MARLRTTVSTPSEVALAAATAKTVLQIIAPANQRIAVRGFSVSFDGTSASAEPATVQLVKQTTAGTMTAATPVKEVPSGETIQMTAQHSATVEPTTTDIIRPYHVHTQTGAEWKFGLDEEIILAGGERLGIRITSPAVVNVLAHIACEE